MIYSQIFRAVLCLVPLCTLNAQSADPTPPNITAAAQDPEAVFQQARAYLHGQGVTKDARKAFDLMQSAAHQGHAEALGGLGYFYANGVVIPKDEVRAVELFRQGAEKGGPKSQYNFGRMLVDGKGVERDHENGRAWIDKAASQGLVEAIFARGKMHFFGEFGAHKDHALAFPHLEKAAAEGHADAQNMVGLMLCDGMGVAQDEAKGIDWFRKAASQGHAKAQSNLGRMLGPSVQHPDKSSAERIEALTWLMVSAGQGETTATKLLEDTLPAADPEEVAEARRHAAAIRNNTNSKGALRKLFPGQGNKNQPRVN